MDQSIYESLAVAIAAIDIIITTITIAITAITTITVAITVTHSRRLLGLGVDSGISDPLIL